MNTNILSDGQLLGFFENKNPALLEANIPPNFMIFGHIKITFRCQLCHAENLRARPIVWRSLLGLTADCLGCVGKVNAQTAFVDMNNGRKIDGCVLSPHATTQELQDLLTRVAEYVTRANILNRNTANTPGHGNSGSAAQPPAAAGQPPQSASATHPPAVARSTLTRGDGSSSDGVALRDRTIAQLKAELDELSGDRELAAVRHKASLELKIRELEAKKRQAETRVSEFEKSLNQTEAQIAQSAQRSVKFRKELQTVQVSIKELNTKIQEWQRQLKINEQNLGENHNQINSLKEEIERHKEMLEQKEEELITLTRRVVPLPWESQVKELAENKLSALQQKQRWEQALQELQHAERVVSAQSVTSRELIELIKERNQKRAALLALSNAFEASRQEESGIVKVIEAINHEFPVDQQPSIEELRMHCCLMQEKVIAAQKEDQAARVSLEAVRKYEELKIRQAELRTEQNEREYTG